MIRGFGTTHYRDSNSPISIIALMKLSEIFIKSSPFIKGSLANKTQLVTRDLPFQIKKVFSI